MSALFISAGISHREAPIAIRERLAVPADQVSARLERLKATPGIREAMLLSTCNRLDAFAVADSAAAADALADELGLPAEHARLRVGDEALRHLFRVASSLDSMVVGEAQILGQVKDAMALARSAGALGNLLGGALARAIGAARRVRTETAIGRGAVSLSSVAVELAVKVLGDLAGRTVLLIGAGQMARLAARELRSAGATEFLVANRSAAHADELAAEIGGVGVRLDELPSLLERADVAVCSAASPEPLVTRELMAQALPARHFRPLFLIDLALPRNVEPSTNRLENVYVYDLDDLSRVAGQNRGLREAELSRAEAIVEEELRAFLAACREREHVPVLARLRRHAQAIAEAELERTLATLGSLSDRQAKSVRSMAAAIVNKLLHAPTQRLRADEGGALAEAAVELFALAAPDDLERRAG